MHYGFIFVSYREEMVSLKVLPWFTEYFKMEKLKENDLFQLPPYFSRTSFGKCPEPHQGNNVTTKGLDKHKQVAEERAQCILVPPALAEDMSAVLSTGVSQSTST